MSTPPRVLNYTTTIDPARTVAEMQQLLVTHGAQAVNAQYEAGQPVALSFTIDTAHGLRSFTLPRGDARPVLELMRRYPNKARVKMDLQQAERVAWRILKDWLEAQLALIATAMVSLEQVMLPYMHADELGTTVFELYQGNAMRALPSGG